MDSLRDAVVLVTPRSFAVGRPDIRAQLEARVGEVRYNTAGRSLRADELREQMADVDGVIAGLDDYDASVFSAAPRLKVLARYGVGTNNVDLRAAAAQGVVVTVTPGANAVAVAELAIAFMFALARSVVHVDRSVQAGEWPVVRGREIRGSTLGLLGLGNIGRAVALRVKALGCEVVAHDPFADAEFARENDIQLLRMEDVAAGCDFLSLHLPLSEHTRNIVDRDLLARMRPGSYLINTARGELVAEADLLWALDHGPLAGAALDTLREEPPPTGHPLLGREDVVITSHIGGQTAESAANMAHGAMTNLLAVLAGKPPISPVTQ